VAVGVGVENASVAVGVGVGAACTGWAVVLRGQLTPTGQALHEPLDP
jgi:hypothetical protein